MAISKEDLAKIISGPARELCKQQARETSSSIKRNPQMMTEEQYYDDDFYYDSINENVGENIQPIEQTEDFQLSRKRVANSKMPAYIKESMVNNPIDVSALDNTSVLSSIEQSVKQNKKRVVNENKVKQPIQTQQTGSVDYSIIKAIVNDCLTNFFKNNGFLSDIKLKSGNIFITDNKGETYVAKLEKINK